ncbi:MAG: FecR domain-containing protein [Ekhidna sp.]|nr:FecR domain-containing protein [Ekhidna sp.]MBC6425033.1 FecR domain-containing protein [Ekhidna sp.]
MSKDLEKYNHLIYGTNEVEVSDNFVEFLMKNSESEVPEIDEEKVWDELKFSIAAPPKHNFFWLKIAASITLLVSVGYLVINLNTSPDYKSVSSNDQRITVKFPDGSEGVLNKSSSFSFPEKFGSERRVSFSGEAYFDIKKSEKPFIIEANGVEVKVLGTAFNLITNESEVSLYVDKGLVAFSKNGIDTKIKAGFEAVFDKSTNEVTINEIPTANIMSWRDGFFKFNNTPLNNAIKDLSEYYEIDFQLSHPKLSLCRISATIDQKSLGEVLSLLEKILDVKAERKNKSVKISGKGC